MISIFMNSENIKTSEHYRLATELASYLIYLMDHVLYQIFKIFLDLS